MSFIKESYIAYKKVQEAADHEISMARGELEAIADKATQLASMLQGKSEEGNPLEAWVQSKITKAKDYINSVSDYMMYNPDMKQNEELQLEESTFEKIYQMQQDGKSLEDIAKELKLKPDLVKKVLGENKIILEGLSDAQIAQLKKEYDPLKGKTITTSQYQQLKNILFKLQDGDLEKLQKQNIPFASTGAGSILRVRKSPVKITSVKVPGLEGMAEESDKKLPKDLEDLDKKTKEIEKKFRDSLKVPTKLPEEIKVDKPSIIKSLQDRLKKVQSEPDNGEKRDMIAYIQSKLKMLQSKSEEVEESFKDNIIKKLVKPIQDYNKKKEEPKKEEADNLQEVTPLQTGIAMMKTLAAAAGIKPATSNNGYQAIYDYKNGEGSFKGQGKKSYEQVKNWIYKNGYIVQTDYLKQIMGEEVEVTESHFEIGQHVIYHGPKNPLTPIKAQIIGVATPQTGAYYQIKKSDGETTYAAPDQMKLDEACWVGYKQVGLKKKGKKMVPNCVPEERRLYIESIVAVKNKAEKSGMPYPVLKQVYDRGMAAWKGGHRPGATQVQWALARVNSFITKSSGTWGGADSDLAKKVKG